MQRCYLLRVAEAVDPAWTGWLGNYTITRAADGTTTITGLFANQESLFHLLHRLGELGVTLLSVEMMQETGSSQLPQ